MTITNNDFVNKKLTPLELNVLEVATDHMIEHLEDVLSTSEDIDGLMGYECMKELKEDNQERLDATQSLKVKLDLLRNGIITRLEFNHHTAYDYDGKCNYCDDETCSNGECKESIE